MSCNIRYVVKITFVICVCPLGDLIWKIKYLILSYHITQASFHVYIATPHFLYFCNNIDKETEKSNKLSPGEECGCQNKIV